MCPLNVQVVSHDPNQSFPTASLLIIISTFDIEERADEDSAYVRCITNCFLHLLFRLTEDFEHEMYSGQVNTVGCLTDQLQVRGVFMFSVDMATPLQYIT